jgi:hypothetical protein
MLLLVYFPASYSSTASPEWVRGLTMLLILLALLLAGLVAGLGRQGTDLSADHRFYRYYFGLLGWRWGRWQPLPPVVGVTLKFYTEVSRGNAGNGPASWGIWNTSNVHYEKLVLLLSLQNSTEGLVLREFSSTELTEARQVAQEVASSFGNVPVHEYLAPQRNRRR